MDVRYLFLMKMFGRAVLLTLLAAATLFACATQRPAFPPPGPEAAARLKQGPATYPAARFVVISDPHFYDPALWTAGEAFERYLATTRIQTKECQEILLASGERIILANPDFVLVCGDLSREGEISSHKLMSSYLDRLEKAGIPVFVVPGNHDLRNPDAARFGAEGSEPVASIDAERFRAIYADFGYNEAVRSDPDSLSYLAEPVPGLWLLALDTCRYREQEDKSIVDGRLYPATVKWVHQVLSDAVREGKAVIPFFHHGIMNHFENQKKFYPDHIIDQGEELSWLLAGFGVRVVFTGHNHAQDVTVKRWNEDGKPFLYDVCTGSLITYPCPYRVVDVTEGRRLTIVSGFLEATASHPQDFAQYSLSYLEERIIGIAVATLRGYGVFEKSARLIAPQVAEAFAANYRGDEKPPKTILDPRGVGLWGRIIMSTQKGLVTGLWHDLEPADNLLTIDLATGAWE
jgi:hypothetical protein